MVGQGCYHNERCFQPPPFSAGQEHPQGGPGGCLGGLQRAIVSVVGLSYVILYYRLLLNRTLRLTSARGTHRCPHILQWRFPHFHPTRPQLKVLVVALTMASMACCTPSPLQLPRQLHVPFPLHARLPQFKVLVVALTMVYMAHCKSLERVRPFIEAGGLE